MFARKRTPWRQRPCFRPSVPTPWAARSTPLAQRYTHRRDISTSSIDWLSDRFIAPSSSAPRLRSALLSRSPVSKATQYATPDGPVRPSIEAFGRCSADAGDSFVRISGFSRTASLAKKKGRASVADVGIHVDPEKTPTFTRGQANLFAFLRHARLRGKQQRAKSDELPGVENIRERSWPLRTAISLVLAAREKAKEQSVASASTSAVDALKRMGTLRSIEIQTAEDGPDFEHSALTWSVLLHRAVRASDPRLFVSILRKYTRWQNGLLIQTKRRRMEGVKWPYIHIESLSRPVASRSFYIGASIDGQGPPMASVSALEQALPALILRLVLHHGRTIFPEDEAYLLDRVQKKSVEELLQIVDDADVTRLSEEDCWIIRTMHNAPLPIPAAQSVLRSTQTWQDHRKQLSSLSGFRGMRKTTDSLRRFRGVVAAMQDRKLPLTAESLARELQRLNLISDHSGPIARGSKSTSEPTKATWAAQSDLNRHTESNQGNQGSERAAFLNSVDETKSSRTSSTTQYDGRQDRSQNGRNSSNNIFDAVGNPTHPLSLASLYLRQRRLQQRLCDAWLNPLESGTAGKSSKIDLPPAGIVNVILDSLAERGKMAEVSQIISGLASVLSIPTIPASPSPSSTQVQEGLILRHTGQETTLWFSNRVSSHHSATLFAEIPTGDALLRALPESSRALGGESQEAMESAQAAWRELLKLAHISDDSVGAYLFTERYETPANFKTGTSSPRWEAETERAVFLPKKTDATDRQLLVPAVAPGEVAILAFLNVIRISRSRALRSLELVQLAQGIWGPKLYSIDSPERFSPDLVSPKRSAFDGDQQPRTAFDWQCPPLLFTISTAQRLLRYAVEAKNPTVAQRVLEVERQWRLQARLRRLQAASANWSGFVSRVASPASPNSFADRLGERISLWRKHLETFELEDEWIWTTPAGRETSYQVASRWRRTLQAAQDKGLIDLTKAQSDWEQDRMRQFEVLSASGTDSGNGPDS